MGAVRTLVIIPAYNEEAALPATLDELRRVQPDLDLVVVDDGSVDRTAPVAREGGATVVTLPFNLGVGSAVRTGLRFALEHGYSRAVVFDADGQHDARSIDDLLAALDRGADVALASRFGPGTDAYPVSRVRRSAMHVLARFVRHLTGQTFTDPTSGYRAFDEPSIRLLARAYPVEYLADTVEVLLILSSAGLTIEEVPSSMRTRSAGLPSNRRLRLVANYLRVIVGLAGAAVFRKRHDQVAVGGADLRGEEPTA
jgi:glycosyltransferase involved in cell wall biosynthesis